MLYKLCKNPNSLSVNIALSRKLLNSSHEVSGNKADVIISSNQNTDVKIIFKNRNTIVSGENCVGYCRFNNISVNEEVYVIGVRYEGGNIFYALQPLKLEKQSVVSLNWKKGNEKDVKKVFRSLT